jgi:hypothetical protein
VGNATKAPNNSCATHRDRCKDGPIGTRQIGRPQQNEDRPTYRGNAGCPINHRPKMSGYLHSCSRITSICSAQFRWIHHPNPLDCAKPRYSLSRRHWLRKPCGFSTICFSGEAIMADVVTDGRSFSHKASVVNTAQGSKLSAPPKHRRPRQSYVRDARVMRHNGRSRIASEHAERNRRSGDQFGEAGAEVTIRSLWLSSSIRDLDITAEAHC